MATRTRRAILSFALAIVPLFAAALVVGMPTSIEAGVSIPTVCVGDPGNVADSRHPDFGAVDYVYNIGQFETTVAQYTVFLNAVGATDTYGVWNDMMPIERTLGASGYTYAALSGRAEYPVTQVNFWNACRFANWLHNGQSTGPQSALTTEDGAYTLDGYTGDDGRTIARNSGAKWWVPSENEWYKAAHYKGGGTNAGYWDYPTQSDSPPVAEPPPGRAEPPGSASYASCPLTEVGAYHLSPGPYGTFDQAGNVWEWTDTVTHNDYFRGLRGGAIKRPAADLSSGGSHNGGEPTFPGNEVDTVGFRVASAPVPARTHVLCVGVRDEVTQGGRIEVRGDIAAQRVRDAFAQLGSVKTARILPLTMNNGIVNNRDYLTQMIEGVKDDVRPGDTFVFYFGGHGGYWPVGDEVETVAKTIDMFGNTREERTTGDEFLGLSSVHPEQNMTDDEFSTLFLQPKWQEVNKLFIIDCCYSGGFMGTADLGDTGDLSQLSRVSLFAASSEGEFSYSTFDDAVGGAVNNLGSALVEALHRLQRQPQIGVEQLFNETSLEGRTFQGMTGYVLGVGDGWGLPLQMSFAPIMQTSTDFELALGIPEPHTVVLLVAALCAFGLMRHRGLCGAMVVQFPLEVSPNGGHSGAPRRASGMRERH